MDKLEEGHSPAAGGRRIGESARLILTIALFLGLAAFCLLPLLPRFYTHFLGASDSDVIRNAWGHWWISQSILEHGLPPRFCHYLNFPMGMIILVIDLLGGILSVPLHLLLPPPAAYNAYILLTLTFNGVALWLLIRDRTGSEAAGLLGGVIVGLGPFVFSMALAGTSELVNVGWVALYLLAALRMAEGRLGRGGRRWILPGLALCAATLNCWYYGYIAGVSTLILFPYYLRRQATQAKDDTPRPWLPIALDILRHWGVFLGFAVVMVILYREIIPNLTQSVGSFETHRQMAVADSVRLWELLEPENARWDKPSLFHLPWYLFPLALMGIPFAKPRVRPFAVCLLLFLTLSGAYAQHSPLPGPPALGPDGRVQVSILQSPVLQNQVVRTGLRHWGAVTEATYDTFRRVVPFSGFIRFPSRYLLIFNLSLSLLIGGLLARLLSLLKVRGWGDWLLGVLLAVLMTQQVVSLGRYHDVTELTSAELPPYVVILAEDPRPLGVLQLPMDQGGGQQIFYQLFHEKPVMAFINFVTSKMRMVPVGGGERAPISYLQTVFSMHLKGYDRQAKAWPRDSQPLPSAEGISQDMTALSRAGFGWVILEEALYKPEDLSVIRSAIEPHLTAMDSGTEGILMYALPGVLQGEGADVED